MNYGLLASVLAASTRTEMADREDTGVMRRQLVSLTFAAMAVMSVTVGASPTLAGDAAATEAPTIAVGQVKVPGPGVRDEVAMVLVGTALIGLAAAVRRAA